MAATDNILKSNKTSTDRLRAVVARLSDEDLNRSLGGNWTVGFAFAHLAFWDARQVAALQRFVSGEPFPSEDMATNATLEALAAAFNPKTIGHVAVDAAQQLDQLVESLTTEQVDALQTANLSYAIDRAAHRDEHLQQIEEGLD